MPSRYTLGLDIGTTATKAIVVDSAGRVAAEDSSPVALSSPRPGWAEESPAQWWDNVRALTPRVLAKAGVGPERIEAVGVCGMVPALVLVGGDGSVLRPSIQQNDARAGAEIAALRSSIDEGRMLKVAGSRLTQQSVGPKALWLRAHEPAVAGRVARIMGSYDYIAHELTGSFSIERNWALESGLMSIDTGQWVGDYLEAAGIDPSWLAEVRAPEEIVGRVSRAAAAECSLLEGTPVVAGCADHVASAFSAGLVSEGDLLVKLGGAGDILVCVDSPRLDPRLYIDYHAVPGKFLVNGCMATSGSLVRWFRDQLAPGEGLGDLDEEARRVPAGSEGLVVLPYFMGEKTPLHDPQARGTVVGLTLAHGRGHLFRATLEGISFGFRHHLEIFRELGLDPKRARLTNGGAHSLLWRQVTADVLGIPLEVVAGHPGSSLGAAFAAGVGVGTYSSWAEIERFVRIDTVVEPDERSRDVYARRFESYLEIYRALKGVYPSLSAVAEERG